MRWPILLGCLVGLCVPLGGAQRGTWVVTPDGTGDFPTIQAAIDHARAGDTIELIDGRYFERDIDFRGKGITVKSRSGNPDACVIDVRGSVGNPGRGFLFVSGEGRRSRLMGVRVTHAYAAPGGPRDWGGWGGGMLVIDSSPIIVHVIADSSISLSTGAGIAILGQSQPIIYDSRFTGNQDLDSDEVGGGGGGVWVSGNSSPVFERCVIAQNSAATVGGGVSVRDRAQLTLWQCTVVGNAAEDGSGVFGDVSTSVRLEKTIVAFNTLGGGISCVEGCGITIDCCDVYGNAGGDWIGGIEEFLGTNGNIAADPLFCDLAETRYSLSPGSPCAGNSASRCGQIGALPVECNAAHLGGRATNPGESTTLLVEPGLLAGSHFATRIKYSIAGASTSSPVRLAMYDAAGRLVRTLVSTSQAGGSYSVTWDGADERGRTVPQGMYFCELAAGGTRCSRHVVVIR